MNQIDYRQIRVFISSTFEDLKDERDYLIKKVFPELKLIASERDVTLVEVDLRWGITKDQANEGRVIDICFNEIDNSIPFFIGIIGNRYGWCPTKKDISSEDCLHYESILRYTERHLSATEMEIQYGVLDRQDLMYASFYIDSRELEYERIDYPDQLKKLKDTILNNQRYPHYFYSSKESLGESVKKQFIEMLDRLFPQNNKLSYVEQLQLSQRIVLNQLCSINIQDEERLKRIDSYINDSQMRQLLIVGDSGVGKSAFVSEWIRRNQNDKNIVYYSVGSVGNSSDVASFLRDLTLLINHKNDSSGVHAQGDINDALDSWDEREEELIVVIDGFNQLQLSEKEMSLDWFPLPRKNCKFIITITSDRDTFKYDSCHINSRLCLLSRGQSEEYFFPVLSDAIRKDIINIKLAKHGKNLDPEVIEEIVANKLFRNGFTLNLLLDEMIYYPRHETIKNEIQKYLNCKSANSFILSVLRRYEKDYGVLLVSKALTLLAISELGFNESELRNLINTNIDYHRGSFSKQTRISQLEWSQFYCAFRNNLSIRGNGLLGFSHQLIKKAIYKKYAGNKNYLAKVLRKQIIEFFKNEHSNRAYVELRHQYHALNLYGDLHHLLTLPDVYYYFINNRWGELSESWVDLCVYAPNPYPLSDCFKAWGQMAASQKEEIYNKVEQILCAIIVEEQGSWPPRPCPESFAQFQENCIAYQKESRDLYRYTFSAGSGFMDTPDKMKHAKELLMDSLKIIEATNHKWDGYFEDLQECYYRIAQWHHFKGQTEEEALYLERFIAPCEDYYGLYHEKTQFAYYIAGYVRFTNGEYQKAIDHLTKALAIVEKSDDYELIIKTCDGLIQCYEAAFKQDEGLEVPQFFNKTNYLKYAAIYEKKANALKELGEIELFNSIMDMIESAKNELGLTS